MLSPVHVIVASSTPAVATAYVRVVLLMGEMAGHGPWLGATIEVRPIQQQERLL